MCFYVYIPFLSLLVKHLNIFNNLWSVYIL